MEKKTIQVVFIKSFKAPTLGEGAFVKALVGTTMVVVVVVSWFTLVQANDAILGLAPTSLNIGLCTHYFISICRWNFWFNYCNNFNTRHLWPQDRFYLSCQGRRGLQMQMQRLVGSRCSINTCGRRKNVYFYLAFPWHMRFFFHQQCLLSFNFVS